MAHILIVDDERDVVSLLKFLLEKDGHRVDTAGNGAQALEKLGVEPENAKLPIPDLMIIDVMMPVMDGYTACERLGKAPRTRSMPVLVLTAKGDMRDVCAQVPNVGAYIEKPFEPKKLRELIAGMLPPTKPHA